MRILSVLLLIFIVSGCSGNNDKPFSMKNLAKSDIDMVTDVNIKAWKRLARELTIKLYKRNPKELKKVPGMTLERRLDMLFPPKRLPNGFKELGYKDGIAVAPIAFADDYHGDRVFAYMAGITGMLHSAYNGKEEMFLLDELSHQKLYNAARNLESFAWHLNNRHDPQGNLYLLSNGIAPDGTPNFSYERILGKLIILQDVMATVIADSTNRTINRVVQGAASMTFFPI